MGNTCSPDNSVERQVADTDKQDVKDAEAAAVSGEGDLSNKDPKQLFEILNSYIAQNEKLVQENEELKGKDTSEKDQEEKKKLLEELEKLKALTKSQEKELEASKEKIKAEEDRIAALKLQRELKEKEAAMLAAEPVGSSILVEGDLLKFTKGGKGKPNYKSVSIYQRPGEQTLLVTQAKKEDPEEEQNVVPVGWTPGSLMLQWSDDEKSMTLSRATITKLIDGAAAQKNKEFENRTFSIETENNKIIAFAAKDEEEKKRWFETISTAMASIAEEIESMNEEFVVEKTFEARPLGFRVEEQILKAADGTSTEVLMVTKVEPALGVDVPAGMTVEKCNETEFAGLTYSKKLEAIKTTPFPFTITFKGQGFLKVGSIATKATVRGAHARDMSMQVLYPELFAELTKDGSESREALLKMPVVQANPELKAMLESSDFKLLKELMSDPEKLRAFMNKDL